MEKKEILDALKLLRENNTKRNFIQSLDLIINLKGMDVKREDQRVDQFLSLPYECGKQVKVCAFVDKQLLKNAQDNCDFVISNEDFQSYAKNKKELKKLANGYDYFISQINVMAEIAKIFGRVLGSRGKMPNPKVGCVVQGTVDLKSLVQKLKKTIHVVTRGEASIKAFIGMESMKDEELAENIHFIYTHVVDSLPQTKNNIKNVLIKFTMGKPHEIGKENESTKLEKAGSK
ncbi:50S ribosomal protein L1 [Candidatus Woesearchaeota archaeon]|nr:50S ribosomal protein L1 [Candidatus Woesearchaeota archaeon]